MTIPPRPVLGDVIEDEWGQAVHDKVFGTSTLIPPKNGDASALTYPVGVTLMQLTTETGWVYGYSTVATFNCGNGWCFQIISAATGAEMRVRNWVSNAWSPWSNNLFIVTAALRPTTRPTTKRRG